MIFKCINDLGGVRFGVDSSTGEYGYKKVGADTIYPFSSSHDGTYTFAEGSTGSTVDLGERHTYRYVNASNVYKKGHDLLIPEFYTRGGLGTNSSGQFEAYLYISMNDYKTIKIGSNDGSGSMSLRWVYVSILDSNNAVIKSWQYNIANNIVIDISSYNGIDKILFTVGHKTTQTSAVMNRINNIELLT